jgi:hypothetical protein
VFCLLLSVFIASAFAMKIFKVPFLLSVLALLHLGSPSAQAQAADDIHGLKWWIGLKTGITFSKVNPLERHSVLTYQDQAQAKEEEKEYSKTTANLGQTIGLIFGYAFTKNLLLTFQPAYSNYKYSYQTKRTWQGSGGESYQLATKQNHRLGYIELPIALLFRIKWKHIEPYLHLGWYYGFYMGGRKKLTYTETYTEGGVAKEWPAETEVRGMNDVMKSQMGLTAGLGVSYTIEYYRIGLEAGWRQGQYNITDTKARYKDQHMVSKFYDVPDDLKLDQFELTLNMFMPVDNLVHLHSFSRARRKKN